MFGNKKGGGLYGAFRQQVQEEERLAKNGATPDTDAIKGGREDIVVYSLKHGTGSSYMAAAVANYLAGHRRGNVSLVLNDTAYAEDIAGPKVNVVSWAEEAAVYSSSSFIVHDIGVYGDINTEHRNALQRGTVKILLCKADGNYLTKLAEHVETVDTSDLIFLFNELPAEWEKRAYDVMDFTGNVYCVPTFYALTPSMQVVKVMDSIFKRKRA